MARNYTGSYALSSKACDIEYRTRRLQELTLKAANILESIDPAAVAEDSIARSRDLISQLSAEIARIAGSKPAKRAYVKGGKAKVAPAEPKRRGRKPKVMTVTEPEAAAPTGAPDGGEIDGILFVGLDDLLAAE